MEVTKPRFTHSTEEIVFTAILRLKGIHIPNIDRARYHLEAALYQLEHPTHESQKVTDATSV